MKIISCFFFFFLVLSFSACGVKSPPVARESLNVPYPSAVVVSLKDDGILLKNYGDNDTISVERISASRASYRNNIYKKITTLSPNGEFLDTTVEKNVNYTYRFKKYDPTNKVYSKPVLYPIKYYPPLTITNVTVVDKGSTACVAANINDATAYANILVNGKVIKTIYNDNETCFKLPSTLTVNILIVPYDVSKNAGTPYEKSLIRDEKVVLLPPQNIKVLRKGNNIVLSWDKYADVSGYSIDFIETKKIANNKIDNYTKYNVENKNATETYDKYDKYMASAFGKKLIENNAITVSTTKNLGETDVTVFNSSIKDLNACYSYDISSIRENKQSEKVRITTCP